jgi:hypothetical protein
MTKYKLVDPRTSRDVEIPLEENLIFDQLWNNRDVSVEPVTTNGPRLQLRLIDTPGLDDSAGMDQENITSVLSFLTDIAQSDDPTHRYISTILFVCNANKAFSADFQEIFKYYRRCMPNLFGSLAIVNTHFSIDKWQQKWRAYLPKKVANRSTHSAKDDVIQERRESFLEYLGMNPQHFFIDSKPRKRIPFEVLTSLNDLAEIISYLSFKDPMPITHMRLIKRDPWKAADMVLVTYLQTIKNHWTKERAQILSTASEDSIMRAVCEKRVLDWEAEIAKCEEDLERYDCDLTYELASYNTRDQVTKTTKWAAYATFQKIKQDFKITEPIQPFFVKTPERKADDAAYWTGFTESPGVWLGHYEGKWRTVPSLNAQSWTYNKHYYADLIFEIGNRKRKRQAELLQERQTLAKLNSRPGANDDNPYVKELNARIAKCEYFIEQLESDEGNLKKGFNKAAMERYARKAVKVRPADLFQFVREEDEDFEAMLRTVRFLLPEGDERAE